MNWVMVKDCNDFPNQDGEYIIITQIRNVQNAFYLRDANMWLSNNNINNKDVLAWCCMPRFL